MNKKYLIKVAAAKSGISQTETEKSLNAILAAIGESLQNEEPVTLIGFGTFSVKERAARMGFNPQQKKQIRIEASKTVKFKASSCLIPKQ